MARLSQFKADLDKEVQGVWVAWELGIRFCIARIGNPSYTSSVRELLRPHRDRIRRGLMEEDEIEKLSLSAVARHILRGWENVEDDAGVQIAYSPERAAEILGNPQYRELYDFVTNCSRRAELYRIKEKDDDLGNSQPASDGASTGGQALSS